MVREVVKKRATNIKTRTTDAAKKRGKKVLNDAKLETKNAIKNIATDTIIDKKLDKTKAKKHIVKAKDNILKSTINEVKGLKDDAKKIVKEEISGGVQDLRVKLPRGRGIKKETDGEKRKRKLMIVRA